MPASSSSFLGFAFTVALLVWGVLPRSVTGRFGESMRDDGPSLVDVERRERGYYEELIDAGRRRDRPSNHTRGDAPFDAGELADAVDDVREFVLKPDLKTMHRGVPWNTNALGMRDQPYEIAKPLQTIRIAIVGDSIGAGWGVDEQSGFEAVLERRLNALFRPAGGPRVEVLNFSVPGHAPGQRWEDFRRLGWSTEPDLLIYEATPADAGWDERRLRGLLAKGVGWDAPQYRQTLAALGVPRGEQSDAYRKLLRPHRRAILEGVYVDIANECRSRDVPSVWVLIPRVGRPATVGEREQLLSTARAARFSAVLDLSDVFDGLDPKSLAISPDDFHPNAKGHARIAGRIEALLRSHAAGPFSGRVGRVAEGDEP
jgi:lysophospholipase L1-like esterase